MVVPGVPAVVVGDHGYGYVANLGFASQLRFRSVGHADYVHAPGAIKVGLRQRGKLWAFHTDVSAAALDVHSCHPAADLQNLAELRTNGVGEADVSNQSTTKKTGGAMLGMVVELGGDHEVERLVFLFE